MNDINIEQMSPNVFRFESKNELQSYFLQTKHFEHNGKRYTIIGNIVDIQATNPLYFFAYVVNVTEEII